MAILFRRRVSLSLSRAVASLKIGRPVFYLTMKSLFDSLMVIPGLWRMRRLLISIFRVPFFECPSSPVRDYSLDLDKKLSHIANETNEV